MQSEKLLKSQAHAHVHVQTTVYLYVAAVHLLSYVGSSETVYCDKNMKFLYSSVI